uniref:Uncharacterized protein n=2 Tax=Oryza TaxID=4527 RepID=A0A0E0QVN4_ORYRU
MAKALELTGEVVQDPVRLFWDAVETGDPLHGGGGEVGGLAAAVWPWTWKDVFEKELSRRIQKRFCK